LGEFDLDRRVRFDYSGLSQARRQLRCVLDHSSVDHSFREKAVYEM
jgi:hypothetical protein